MRRNCEANIVVDAPAEAIWALVSDVSRVGEWSGECRGCEWLGGADAPVPGARFVGHNRRGWIRWSRLNEVAVVDPPHGLAWRTIWPTFHIEVKWRIRLVTEGSATRVTESLDIISLPLVMDWLFCVITPTHRDRTADLIEDLKRLKSVVEAEVRSTV
jgi:Polyketide cyclase / dehydrase and lipid transport